MAVLPLTTMSQGRLHLKLEMLLTSSQTGLACLRNTRKHTLNASTVMNTAKTENLVFCIKTARNLNLGYAYGLEAVSYTHLTLPTILRV